jgi:hypothetical protein
MDVAKGINKETPEVLTTVGNLGWQYVQTVAPEYTGALKAAIINFPENKSTWIIMSSRPQGDKIPVHVMFEEGVYPNPRNPGSLRFMTQTREFLEAEFSEKLRLKVNQIIERSRKVM